MPDVAAFSIVRQGDRKKAIPARDKAVVMEPVSPASSSSAKIGGSVAVGLNPLERIFNKQWMEFFGEHAVLPPQKTRTKAGSSLDAEATFAKLYKDLHQAWTKRDADKLERVASTHLTQQATSGVPVIDPVTRRFYEFFKARGCEGSGAELLAMIKTMSTAEINDYLTSSAQLVSKLKAQAFAAIVNGTLSQQGIDLLLAIKTIGAFQFIAAAYLHYGAEASKIPVKMICATLDADVTFPEWTFDVDPCRWPKAGDVVANPRGDTGVIQTWTGSATAVDAAAQASAMAASPMRQRLDREAKVVEQRSAAGKAAERTAGTAAQLTNPPPKPNLSDPCDCTGDLNRPCLPPDPCCAKINYYVTDTLVLRDKVKRYIPSDLAYIENVVIGETRTREHSFAKTIEDYTEEEVTTTKSEERDHQVTARFSVQNEIEKNVKMAADAHAEYNGATANGGTYKLSANGSISKETAQKEAREQFREAIDKAVSKLQVETRKLSSRRVTTREEEKNIHTFENAGGDSHIVAKYFYVSKEVEGQIYSHGLRTTVELLIPSPAALYEHLQVKQILRSMPCIPDAVSIDDLDVESYREFEKKYCFAKSLPSPDLPMKPFDEIFKPWSNDKKDGLSGVQLLMTVPVPKGFRATNISMDGNNAFLWEADDGESRIVDILIDDVGIGVDISKNGDGEIVNGHYDKEINKSQNFNLQFVPTNIRQFGAVFTVHYEPLPVDHSEWKIKVRDAINEANRQKMTSEFLAKSKENQKGRHPFINKEIILSELKRAAIYMMCEDFERGGVMNMKSQPCGYPEINRKAASEKTWDWYFWERAFDWKLMSFVFFDYFWNRMCDWPEKFQPGHDDFMFNAFLRSGMARIMVPVSPGMEADIIFYLNTGQKWGLGGQPPVNPSDPRWVSVVEELKHQRDCYQNDREGMITPSIDTPSSNTQGVIVMESAVLLKGSDRYWDPFANADNFTAVNNDVGREIYIDGLQYRIVGIALDANSPVYDPTSTQQTMWWKITLSRPFEFDGQNALTLTSTVPDFAYAIGAEFIGAPFRWQEPTNLVWIGDQANALGLPSYPFAH